MSNILATYWAEGGALEYPYVHPQDVPFFECHRPKDLTHPRVDAHTFPSDKMANDPHFFHLSLIPVPYIGDLARADIFVLMLNPGFKKQEYAMTLEISPNLETRLRTNAAAHGLPVTDYLSRGETNGTCFRS